MRVITCSAAVCVAALVACGSLVREPPEALFIWRPDFVCLCFTARHHNQLLRSLRVLLDNCPCKFLNMQIFVKTLTGLPDK